MQLPIVLSKAERRFSIFELLHLFPNSCSCSPYPQRSNIKAASDSTEASTSETTSGSRPQPFKIGFTQQNERFVGRMAMFGFAASLIGEVGAILGALC